MITDDQIKKLKADPNPEKRVEVAVGDGSGLVIRVLPDSRKVWSLAYTVKTTGERRRIKIGEYGGGSSGVSLSDARKEARKLRVVIDAGGDPQGERRVARAAKRGQVSFKEVAARFLKEERGHWRPSTERFYKWHIEGKLDPVLGKLAAASIDVDHLRPLVDDPSGCFGTARTVFKWAVTKGILKSNPAAGLEPRRRGADEKRRNVRDAVYSDEQLTAVLAAEPPPLVRLVMLTAVREHEARSMRWSDIEKVDGARLWRCRGDDTKTGSEHLVPLSPAAVRLLARQRRDSALAGSDYVFPATGDAACSVCGEKGHAPGLSSKISAKLKKAAGVEGFGFLHRFRHSIASRMADKGIDARAIELILGHKLPGLLATYSGAAELLPQRREALVWWSGVLAGLRS